MEQPQLEYTLCTMHELNTNAPMRIFMLCMSPSAWTYTTQCLPRPPLPHHRLSTYCSSSVGTHNCGAICNKLRNCGAILWKTLTVRDFK